MISSFKFCSPCFAKLTCIAKILVTWSEVLPFKRANEKKPMYRREGPLRELRRPVFTGVKGPTFPLLEGLLPSLLPSSTPPQ